MNGNRKSGQFVVPGEKLGVIEEFIPNSGTYVEDGMIRSNSTGYVLIDLATRKISVYPLARNQNIPRIGNIVIGNIINMQSSMAMLRIMKEGKKSAYGFFTGVIHVSDVSYKYTEDIFDAFKVGDIVRAKVVSNKNKIYHLTTKGDNLGVIHASCSQCGNPLFLNVKILRCMTCGNVEKRKISSDYGIGIL